MEFKRITYYLFFFLVALTANAQQDYSVKKLPFNSATFNEAAPVFYKVGIVFSSDKPSTSGVETINQLGSYPFNIYYVEKKGGKRWGIPDLFSKSLKSNYNESSACFSSDQNTIYFTREQVNVDLKGDQLSDIIPKNGLFYSTFNAKDWAIPRPFNRNDESYDIISPSLSADGNRLFFASKKPGGYGGYDLYYCDYSEGRWQQAINLGPKINTDTSEVFPFIHESGRLYFSSKGHESFWGLDIYYTEMVHGEWVEPIRLPLPINSRQDDYACILNADMDTGYFTSDRLGTNDIFVFTSQRPAFPTCPVQIEETFCYELSELGSLDLDTTALKYEWDFGDGTKIRGVKASHCFAEPGQYLVALNVIDTLTNDIYFNEATYSLQVERLEQAYILMPDTSYVGETITLNAVESNLPTLTIENYFWDFGDGSTGLEIQTEYTYKKPGSYFVKLGVTGKNKLDPAITEKACVIKEITILKR